MLRINKSYTYIFYSERIKVVKIHAIYANTELERKAITPQITERKQANLTAALINYKSDMPLNKFFAIEILLDTQGITEFTAISRHSEYWCKPVFCKSASDIPENTAAEETITQKKNISSMPLITKVHIHFIILFTGILKNAVPTLSKWITKVLRICTIMTYYL